MYDFERTLQESFAPNASQVLGQLRHQVETLCEGASDHS